MIRPCDYHQFETEFGTHVLLSDGSRIFDIEPAFTARDLERLNLPVAITGEPIEPPPLYSLSLNIAQTCNMSCAYCYAGEGPFGGAPRSMSRPTAFASVDRLIEESGDSDTVVVGFMGGEPLLSRSLLHETTEYAALAGARAGKRVKFSMTTNLTLARDEDLALFRDHDFNITVSIDGNKSTNDLHRRLRSGHSAYDSIISVLERIERIGRPRHLSARMTVARGFSPLLKQLRHVLSLGFDDAGFAPVLSAPREDAELEQSDFARFLDEMTICGEYAFEELLQGRPFPFANLETALFEIHRGSHRPYPCGAGAGYLSVNADGDFFACHRLVDNEAFVMGSVSTGADLAARRDHLARRHVDSQEPCRGCWARYLCGGGCHHEVWNRGRPSCDYIRGWLDFCLKSYVRLQELRPGYFTQGRRASATPMEERA